MRSDIRELPYSSNFLCIFPPLLDKNLNIRQNIASTKNCQEFLASQVPVLKRNKLTNSITSNHPFFSSNENHRIYSNSFTLFKTYHHIRTGSLLLGVVKRIDDCHICLHLYSQVVNLPCECDGKSKNFESFILKNANKTEHNQHA